MYERGVEVREEYNDSLTRTSLQRKNLGLEVPLCVLSIEVRLRDARPVFGWRRSVYRVKGVLRTVACKATTLTRYTTDMDHAIVVRAEKQLAQLREIWSVSQDMRRAIARLLKLNEHAGVGSFADPEHHYPDTDRRTPTPEATPSPANHRHRPGVLTPAEMPIFKADDEI